MILVVSAIQALLSQLTSSQSSPHTALLTLRINGTVLAASYVPSVYPFPPASLSDRDNDERTRMYAAVGGSCWTDERGYASPTSGSNTEDVEILKVETEVSSILDLH